MIENTTIFNVNVLRQELIMMTINEVVLSLEKNGYNPTNQLIGYLLTNDLSYITSKDNAREKISKYSREELLMAIINGYMGR
ncbi:MAG: IreB family regulatory phosphoprotein [Bacilli bacterium]|nr:IreB family regulatory phosphoprotein [Bacilli bacterium]